MYLPKPGEQECDEHDESLTLLVIVCDHKVPPTDQSRHFAQNSGWLVLAFRTGYMGKYIPSKPSSV
jgi:hypothetical protein